MFKMQTSSFQTRRHLFFHFGAGTLTTPVFTLKQTRPWHMAALQRFIPLGNIRRGVKLRQKVFLDEFLLKQGQLLLNIVWNHTVYIKRIYWVDIFLNVSPPPPWDLVKNLIKKLKNRWLLCLIHTIQPSNTAWTFGLYYISYQHFNRWDLKKYSGRGKWATVGGVLQCVMFFYRSYWGEQARPLGSQCVCETGLTVIQAVSGTSTLGSHP